MQVTIELSEDEQVILFDRCNRNVRIMAKDGFERVPPGEHVLFKVYAAVCEQSGDQEGARVSANIADDLEQMYEVVRRIPLS